MSQATTSEEYANLLEAQRLMLIALKSGDDKLGAKSQGTRALVEVIRLKRDIRGVPDPRPVDVSNRKPAKSRHQAVESFPDAPAPPEKSKGAV